VVPLLYFWLMIYEVDIKDIGKNYLFHHFYEKNILLFWL
jgi:hypothetical protein